MIREALDRRILTALRFVDATVRSHVTTALELSGEGVRTIRNGTGLHILTAAPGFAAYTDAFAAAPAVPAADVVLTVRDRAGRYLPRSVAVALPRDPDPAHADLPGSLFRPLEVALYPAPAAVVGAGWATLRLRVVRAGGDQGLPFAYVRLVRISDNVAIGAGLADERGEALVAVAGVPVTSWSTSPTAPPVVSTIAVRATAYYDATAYDPAAGVYPDPDRLEAIFSSLPHSTEQTFDLASGREEARRIDVPLPP